MSNSTDLLAALCPTPFLPEAQFDNGGFVEGRLCQQLTPEVSCCLPCPITHWTFGDKFDQMNLAAEWVGAMGAICCVYLLLSWRFLPVKHTHRHYLSICLAIAVLLLCLGFVVPLLTPTADECYDAITPNSMETSIPCAFSGFFLVVGGWAGVMWVFLRALSLHLQICWHLVLSRHFMWFSHACGWGVPAIGVTLALTLSGVSFRLGSSCHVNYNNSLADFWVALLIFSGTTIIIQFATFCYCIRVYLISLSDKATSTTEHSQLPNGTHSMRSLTPRQAYRRLRRVIYLQWRGIFIVMIIVTQVIFFSIVFVFQDTAIQSARANPESAQEWIICLSATKGNRDRCLDAARSFVVSEATVGTVLILLASNGIWMLILFGRTGMLIGWYDLVRDRVFCRNKIEFGAAEPPPSTDIKMTPQSDFSPRKPGHANSNSYDFDVLSSPASTQPDHGRVTPDYFNPPGASYHAPTRSFSRPRPTRPVAWDPIIAYTGPETNQKRPI